MILTVAVVFNLAVLGYFKYVDFFVDSVTTCSARSASPSAPPLLQVILPVGISFFTFQALSYVIDVYRRDAEPVAAARLRRLPVVLPAPGGRADRARPRVPAAARRAPADPRHVEAALAFRLIVAGLFKKVVIANFLAAAIVDQVFADPGRTTVARDPASRIYAYALQIYADFCGYTDIAIGVRAAARLPLPAELRRPVHRRARSRTSGAGGT